MDIKIGEQLKKLGLNSDNSIVIGSGILGALGIRKSNDIDLVITQEAYDILKKSGKFSVEESHGREMLKKDLFEIATSWFILEKSYNFKDFLDNSTIIVGVRYLKLEFLYKIKKSWIDNKTARPKDIADVELMKKYLENRK